MSERPATTVHPDVADLIEWLDSCPTPFHVAARAAAMLDDNGFTRVDALDSNLASAGYVTRDGLIIAWRQASSKTEQFRIVGAHTDSPNLRIHPNPDIARAGWSQLGIEIYGGVLLNSWLDRDLGIAGRIVRDDGTVSLFSAREPLARVPQLAIHLDREIGERGLQLDRHQHMTPVWASNSNTSFIQWLAELSGVRRESIAAFDAHLFDVATAAILGHDRSLLASGRLDNQLSCWAAIRSLIDAGQSSTTTQIVALFDHEEVGSTSVTGAAGPLLAHLTESLHSQSGGRAAFFDALAASVCISADNAHAVHPNYTERHDANHSPLVNCGPALKVNSNQRYATSSRTAQMLRSLAQVADTPLQTFVSRNNMPCGSTIGPIASTALGVDTVDIGVPQLSMHSARELCGVDDPPRLHRLLTAFLNS